MTNDETSDRVLAGRRAIVTGSTRGLGRAYARAMAAAGASVLVNGTTQGLVDDVVEEITSAGGVADGHAGTVASFAGAEALVQRCVDAFGGVDIVVNNAGVIAERMMFNMTEEEFRGPFEVDAFGTFAVSRFAVRDMRPRGWGRIINVGDISAQTGLLGGTNVAAAKGAVHGMTYTWGSELARWRITANCIIPEAYTRMHDPLYLKAIELARERGDAAVPTFEEMVARAARPEDVAPFIVFLASDAAHWVTGQVFTVTRERVALWSHAAEKAEVPSWHRTSPGDLADAMHRAFASEVEPVGINEPWAAPD